MFFFCLCSDSKIANTFEINEKEFSVDSTSCHEARGNNVP